MSNKKAVILAKGTDKEREVGIEFGVAIEAKDGRVSKCVKLENKEGFILRIQNPKESDRLEDSVMWLSEESFRQLLCNTFFMSSHINFDLEKEMEHHVNNSDIDILGFFNLKNNQNVKEV